MRLKTKELSRTIVRVGRITASDLRKAFHLPESTALYIIVPYDKAEGDTLNLDEKDIHITVRIEEVKP